MPELPEVETIRSGLAPYLTGATISDVIVSRPDLRFAFPQGFAARLEGQTIIGVSRRAKYLLFTLSGGETWLSHLGMTGNYAFKTVPLAQPSRLHTPDAGKHQHVKLTLTHPDHPRTMLIYSDPRRFGFMDLFTDPQACTFLSHLGPEPLGNELSAQSLALRFAGRRGPIKSALLDQRHIAGLGNIYVCEALWRTGLHPALPAGRLVTAAARPTLKLEELVRHIRDVLAEAIAAGGSTLRDFKNSDGEAGYFQHNFDVYGREGAPCRRPGCQGTIARIVQSGRSSFFCPVCQRERS